MIENIHQRPILISKREGGIFSLKRRQGEYFQGPGFVLRLRRRAGLSGCPCPRPFVAERDRTIRIGLTFCQLEVALGERAREAQNTIAQKHRTKADEEFVHQIFPQEAAGQFAPSAEIDIFPRAAFQVFHQGGQRSADDFESVAFARLPSSRNYVVAHARHLGDLATLAHFHPAYRGLAAHDGGIDLGKEVRHHRFTFFVDDEIIHSTVPPSNIPVDADSEPEDDFSGHAATVKGRLLSVNRNEENYDSRSRPPDPYRPMPEQRGNWRIEVLLQVLAVRLTSTCPCSTSIEFLLRPAMLYNPAVKTGLEGEPA